MVPTSTGRDNIQIKINPFENVLYSNFVTCFFRISFIFSKFIFSKLKAEFEKANDLNIKEGKKSINESVIEKARSSVVSTDL